MPLLKDSSILQIKIIYPTGVLALADNFSNKILLVILFFYFSAVEIKPQEDFHKIQSMVNSVSAENLKTHIKALEKAGGFFSRVNLTPGNDSAAVYIFKTLSGLKNISAVKVDTFYIESAVPPYNKKPLLNLSVTIIGKSSQYYVAGAHYDCSASRMGSSIWNNQWKTIKAPGADDNATGVAAILEMARILTDSSFGFSTDYSIKLAAFNAEESGPGYSGSHYGSRYFAQQAKNNNETVLGMFSVDMIGYNNLYDYTSIVSDSYSSWLGEKLIDANKIYSIGLNIDDPPFPEATYSDHDSFWNENYRAVLLIENAPPWNSNSYYNANPYYHTSSDTFGTVNLNLVKKVTQLGLATIASLGARLTGVNSVTEKIQPDEFYLSQNFPNPFNPSTTISYRLASDGYVTLKVYDELGREIKTLVNRNQKKGSYSINFSANEISSGIYFYRIAIHSDRLQTGSFISTKKMLLLK